MAEEKTNTTPGCFQGIGSCNFREVIGEPPYSLWTAQAIQFHPIPSCRLAYQALVFTLGFADYYCISGECLVA